MNDGFNPKAKRTITTPEGITFSLTLAGPVSRFLAVSIDIGAVTMLTGILQKFIRMFDVISPDISMASIIITYFLLFMGFSMVFEWGMAGQTPGKRVVGIRVIDADGLRLLPVQVIMRNLFRVFDMMPVMYGLGGLICILTSRRQRLGDIVANTLVIRDEKIVRPDMTYIEPGRYNSFRDHPQLVARLRQKTGTEEAYLAASAVARRDEMGYEARHEVFRELMAHFRSKVMFPDDVIEGLSDEQYVRNIADILMVQS